MEIIIVFLNKFLEQQMKRALAIVFILLAVTLFGLWSAHIYQLNRVDYISGLSIDSVEVNPNSMYLKVNGLPWYIGNNDFNFNRYIGLIADSVSKSRGIKIDYIDKCYRHQCLGNWFQYRRI
jgi:hypothetical protein